VSGWLPGWLEWLSRLIWVLILGLFIYLVVVVIRLFYHCIYGLGKGAVNLWRKVKKREKSRAKSKSKKKQ
jgi:hypothetical protein